MPVELTIPRASTSTTSPPYTIYHLHLRTPLRTHILSKRYSDFDTLHRALVSTTSLAPPAPLPAKSWFSRTVNNAHLTEERRKGLEAYLQAIGNARDTRWRDSDVWRKFLELGPDEGKTRPGSEGTGIGSILNREVIRSSSQWLDSHTALKGKLQEARLQLARREQATAPGPVHEAGANAKKALVQASNLIGALDEGLTAISGKSKSRHADVEEEDGWGAVEKLGEGEVRRRRDLISTARKEHSSLEAVLNTQTSKNLAASSSGGQLGHNNSSSTSLSSTTAASNSNKAPLFRGAQAGRGRVLGGPPKETERTRELDNDGVLQLQKQVMAEQDQDVVDLTQVVRRMRDMGVAINEELVAQNAMLDIMEGDVERVDNKIRIAKKRTDKIR